MAALITGANRGIGRALFDHYSTNGDAIGTSRDGAAPFERLDVRDPKAQTALAHRLKGRAIDLLVCNAGVYPDKGQRLEDGYGADLWADAFATNVTGVFLSIQALLPNLRAATNPRIAIIASQMASQELAPGGSYIYRASKAAAVNLGRNLAVDLRADGIAVGIYHPGWVQTDMGGSAAAITVAEARDGLIQRFAELSIETTGCFQTWDGRTHPF